MKKIISLCLLLIVTVLLPGCSSTESHEASKTSDFDYPEQLTIKKEILLVDGEEESDYKPLVITESTKIKSILDDFHKVNYYDSNQIIDFDGYAYVLEWENTKIQIANEDYLYENDPNTLYKVTEGNFEFLEELEFEQE